LTTIVLASRQHNCRICHLMALAYDRQTSAVAYTLFAAIAT
jgi:hypothetical protein